MMINCLFLTFCDFEGLTQCFSKAAAGKTKQMVKMCQDTPKRKVNFYWIGTCSSFTIHCSCTESEGLGRYALIR